MIQIGFGIFCSNFDGTLSTNHSFRLRSLSFQRVLETLKLNIKDFICLLELCKKEEIEVFRLGSSFIPYASHENFKEQWLYKLEPVLYEVAEKIRTYSQIRITMHPGQFVVLNSPNESIKNNSLKELLYHFWILDTLGISRDGIVIVHIGGSYSNKKRSVERFIETIEKNDWLKRRLAIENDEILFTAEDVLLISQTIEVPFVFDYFHHKINPSPIEFKDIVETWKGRGVPKVHLSSQGSGKIGVHGDYVDINDFIYLRQWINKSYCGKVHVMLEAKKKELALRELKKSLLQSS